MRAFSSTGEKTGVDDNARRHPSADPPQPLDRATQLVRVHARVALRRVEVLVPEQLLDLAQVRAGTQELGGENVPERVRRHMLALVDAGGVDVVAERLA